MAKNKELTKEGHRNRIILKAVIYGGIILFLLVQLRKQKKGKGIL